jgi:hypothetical protein
LGQNTKLCMDMRCGVSDIKSDKSLVDGAPVHIVSIIIVIGCLQH